MADPLGLIGSGQGASALRGLQAGRAGGAGPTDPNAPAFKDILTQNLDQVNQLQREASTATEDLVTGKRNDVEGVLLATQKADSAFRMLLALRNKVQAAYDEIKQVRV